MFRKFFFKPSNIYQDNKALCLLKKRLSAYLCIRRLCVCVCVNGHAAAAASATSRQSCPECTQVSNISVFSLLRGLPPGAHQRNSNFSPGFLNSSYVRYSLYHYPGFFYHQYRSYDFLNPNIFLFTFWCLILLGHMDFLCNFFTLAHFSQSLFYFYI